MQEISKFHVGLDVHKDSISVAVAEAGDTRRGDWWAKSFTM